MPESDNQVDPPSLRVLLSPGDERFFAETFRVLAWLKFLWTGPNPSIAVDLRTVYGDTKFSPQSLYQSIIEAVEHLALPGVECGPVILHESGPFSPYRAYLSIKREWSEVLVCAAPVGTSFLVSMRRIDHFPHVKWFHYLPLFLGLFFAFGVGFALDGILGGFLVMALVASFVWSVFRYAARAAQSFCGRHLPYIPFVGPIYVRWFRPDTFYRQDLQAAFLSLVDHAVRNTLEGLNLAQGFRITTETREFHRSFPK